MIKKHGLLYFIKYYNLLPFTLITILIVLFQDMIIDFICKIQNVNKLDSFYNLTRLATTYALWGGWIYLLFSFFRSKSYRYRTGRSYDYDHGHYHRSYGELVDYFKNAEPHKLDTSVFPVANWKDTKGLIFGRDKNRLISIPSDSECNIAVFGPPGSGKTSGFAIINACQFEGSVLAVDIKGDLYNYVSSHTDRKILRFAPDNPDALEISCRFDPFESLSDMTETEKKLYITNMSIILIPDEGGNDGNYFSNRARKLFQGITYLILFEKPDSSFPDIIHSILEGNVFDWVKRAISSECIPAKELLASFYGNNEKNVSGAYDMLVSSIYQFSNPILDELLSKGDNTISIKNLEEGSDIYLQISQDHLDAYAPIFTLLLQSFSNDFAKRPDSSSGKKLRPILMLLDEFPQLTFDYKLINSNLSTLRSRKILIMLLSQSQSQLEYKYNQNGARAILGNCNYQIILGANDDYSPRVYSNMFGTKKELKVSNSISYSRNKVSGKSTVETDVTVFPPEKFSDLPAENKLIIYFKGKYAELTKLNCYH